MKIKGYQHLKKLNVFIESGDSGFAESLAEAVVRCGAGVVGKGDGKDGFFSSGNFDVNLLLLDIRESDGAVAVTKRIKKEFPHIEVLLINRQDNVRTSMLAMQAGARDELMVPVDLDTLKEKIEVAAQQIDGKKKSICEKFSDVMVAATFAQAGEFETAIDLMDAQSSEERGAVKDKDVKSK